MHDAARAFVARTVEAHGPFDVVVEIGSRDVNGGVRDLFGAAAYTGVDLAAGPGVDVVADAEVWVPPAPPDCVVSCGVLEHVATWEGLLDAAGLWLVAGGLLVVTTVCDPWPAHSAVDGGSLRPGEYYAGVSSMALGTALRPRLWAVVELVDDGASGDVFVAARRR